MTPEQAYQRIASSNLELHNYLQTQQIKIQNTIDPQLIKTILQDPQYTYFYTKYFLKERWPEGEQVILQSPEYTYYYIRNILKEKWPEGEKTILQDPEMTYYYIQNILKERWPEGEKTILNSQDPQLIKQYQEWLKNQRKQKKNQWPHNKPTNK